MRTEQSDWEGTLIESQGVNAGEAIDAKIVAPPATSGAVPLPPGAVGYVRDEMVGLPGQLPGYPGQQRSVETS